MLSALFDLYLVFYVYFPVLLCLSVSVKCLAVETASEMTYTVSGGALNSTHSLTHSRWLQSFVSHREQCRRSR